MNTKIEYVYRDAANYKMHNECIIEGGLSLPQIRSILNSLQDGEFFIPSLVGMPEERFDTYNPELDHPFFEFMLGEFSFTPTHEAATLHVSPKELVKRFRAHRNKWFV